MTLPAHALRIVHRVDEGRAGRRTQRDADDMPWMMAMLFGLPCALGFFCLYADRHLARFSESHDDLWQLPRPSSLRR